MPGCGKTRLGKVLAMKLRLPFIDLDDEIIYHTGKRINEIFDKHGEDFFRKEEHDQLYKITRDIYRPNFVMATGGGAPCFHDNMKFMNEEGITVYLNVPVLQIYERLNKKGSHSRPLLKDFGNDSLLKELESKLENRNKYYNSGKITINSGFDCSIESRVEEIIDNLDHLKKQADT